MRIFQVGDRSTILLQALAEFGRIIEKTLHTFLYIDGGKHRRNILNQLD